MTVASPASRRPRVGAGVTPYLFILPFFACFGLFGLYGLIRSFAFSFTDQTGLAAGNFVGLANYTRLFADPNFLEALAHTVVLAMVVVPVLSVGALALAWVLRSPGVKLQRTLRSIFLLPFVPSLVVVGVAFILLFDPQFGPLARVLEIFGLPAINLTTDAAATLPVLSLVLCWRYLGYNVVIHLSAVQSIPTEVLESAQLDGAGAWRTFWHVVVPLCRRSLIFTAILSTIGIFNLFEEVFIIYGVQAGPQQSGLVTGLLIYRSGFVEFNLGYASAMAYVVTAIVVVLALIQLRLRGKEARR